MSESCKYIVKFVHTSLYGIAPCCLGERSANLNTYPQADMLLILYSNVGRIASYFFYFY